jgi:hypothetical protein
MLDRMAASQRLRTAQNELSRKTLAVVYGRQAATTYSAVGIDGIPPPIWTSGQRSPFSAAVHARLASHWPIVCRTPDAWLLPGRSHPTFSLGGFREFLESLLQPHGHR